MTDLARSESEAEIPGLRKADARGFFHGDSGVRDDKPEEFVTESFEFSEATPFVMV